MRPPTRRPFPALAGALALALAAGAPGAALAQAGAPPPAAAAPPATAPAIDPAGAAALAIDAAGAAALAEAIADGMERMFDDGVDGTTVDWEDDPEVSPAGDHYDVALPALSSTGADGNRIDIGVVRLRVRPLGAGRYDVAVTLPSTMPVTAGDEDEPGGSVTIGTHRIEGVWMAPFDTFLTAEVAVNDLVIDVPEAEGRMAIGAITYLQDLQPDGPDTWGGPAALAISKLSMSADGDDSGTLDIDGWTVEADADGMNLAEASRLNRMMPSTTDPMQAIATTLQALSDLAANATLRTTLTGLTVGDGEGQTMRLDRIALQGGMQGVGADRGTASFGIEARGLNIAPSLAPREFAPDQVEIKLALTDLPGRTLWTALADVVAGTGSKRDRRDARARVLAMLAEAGTALRIERMQMQSPALGASTEGVARVAPDSALGAVADLTVRLRGLDAAADALRPKPGRQPDEETQETLGVIALLQAMGQPDAAADGGGDSRIYRIEVTGEGGLRLNGADMSALFGGAPPVRPKASP